jgi:4-phytase/acid phosphatase
LLRLDWVLPDTGRDLCPPGGGIVFELRKRDTTAANPQYFVRVYYAAQTLRQLREDSKLSLESPPSIAPIFVPGSSQPGSWFDSPLQDFLANAKQSIDPKLVMPIDDGNL